MVAFRSARSAINCAIATQKAVAEHNRLTPGETVLVKIGVNIGDVIEEEGDVFGTAVDAASRLVAQAKGGQILVSEMVRGVVGASKDFEFVELGRFKLKGFPERWRLYEVLWQAGRASSGAVSLTIMFTDIEGYVGLFDQRGDETGYDLLRAYHAIIRAQAAAMSASLVKPSGDIFLLAFESCQQAIRCAIGIERALAIYNSEHSEWPIAVRIGIHEGTVIKEADDLYGNVVNLAARIANAAQGGEILASSRIRDLATGDSDILFDAGRDVELRSFSGKHTLFTIKWR